MLSCWMSDKNLLFYVDVITYLCPDTDDGLTIIFNWKDLCFYVS